MAYLLIGLLLFLGVHSISIIGPQWRDDFVRRVGAGPWRGLYSLISLVGLLMLVHGYGLARQAPQLFYVPPVWARHFAALLLLPVFPLLFAAYLPGRIKTKVRHPMLLAVAIWAGAHLLTNGNVADVMLFGGFLFWAILDLASFKYRASRPIRTASPRPLNDGIAIALGLLAYSSFVLWLHVRLIGVAPLPL